MRVITINCHEVHGMVSHRSITTKAYNHYIQVLVQLHVCKVVSYPPSPPAPAPSAPHGPPPRLCPGNTLSPTASYRTRNNQIVVIVVTLLQLLLLTLKANFKKSYKNWRQSDLGRFRLQRPCGHQQWIYFIKLFSWLISQN